MYKKFIYVNKGSKVPSFAFKCVFYRAEHNAKVDTMGLNLEGLEIKKWNIPWTELKKQIKNGIICLVIMLLPILW